MVNTTSISRRASRILFLGFSIAGVLLEAIFAIPILVQQLAPGHEVSMRHLFTYAPLTLFLGLVSLTMFSWWMANRRVGVPCYREVLTISLAHAVFISILMVGAVWALVTPGSDQFIYYAFWAPALGQCAVFIGLVLYAVQQLRLRTSARTGEGCGPALTHVSHPQAA